MKVGRLIGAAGLAMACLAAISKAQGTPRIAVIHPFQIMQQMTEYKDFNGKYKAETDQLNAALAQREQKIKDLMNQRSQIKPSHPSYAELSAKIDEALTERDAWKQIVSRQGEREKKQAVRDLFAHIQNATAAVARTRQIDLVLTQGEEELPDIESLEYQALMMNIAQRSVIYSTKSVDISDAVLTQVDADYAASRKNGAAVAPAPAPAPATGTTNQPPVRQPASVPGH